MDQVWPIGVPAPQRRTTMFAKRTLHTGLFSRVVFRILDVRSVDSDVFVPIHPHAGEIAAKVNGVPSAARGLATGFAVTKVERIRMGGFKFKTYESAVAGAGEMHCRRVTFSD